MAEQSLTPASAEALTYCEVHPDRETALRCNKCNRLMCTECAVQTPVGYRCRQCIRQHDNKFFTATNNDDIWVLAVCAGLMAVGGAIMSAVNVGLWIALIVGLPIGGAISEVALRVTKRRRGRHSGEIAAVGVVIGAILGAMVQTYLYYNSLISKAAGEFAGEIPGVPLDLVFSRVISDIGLLLFIGLVAAAVYGRFKMRM